MKTFAEKRFFEWHEDDVAVTLRNKSGSYGGGQRSTRYLLYTDTIGSLTARDYKGVGNEYVQEGKLIIEIINSSGGGISGTIDSNYFKGQGEREGTEREYIVEVHRDDSRPPDTENQ